MESTDINDFVFVMDHDGAEALPAETILSYDTWLANIRSESALDQFQEPWLHERTSAFLMRIGPGHEEARRVFGVYPSDFHPVR